MSFLCLNQWLLYLCSNWVVLSLMGHWGLAWIRDRKSSQRTLVNYPMMRGRPLCVFKLSSYLYPGPHPGTPLFSFVDCGAFANAILVLRLLRPRNWIELNEWVKGKNHNVSTLGVEFRVDSGRWFFWDFVYSDQIVVHFFVTVIRLKRAGKSFYIGCFLTISLYTRVSALDAKLATLDTRVSVDAF